MATPSHAWRPAGASGSARSTFSLLPLASSLSLAGAGGEVPTWDVKHDLACQLPTRGPVDDVRCDVEAVEEANSEQLYAILHELTNTSYFRLMQVQS